MSKKSRRRNKKILAALALAGGAAMLGRGKGASAVTGVMKPGGFPKVPYITKKVKSAVPSGSDFQSRFKAKVGDTWQGPGEISGVANRVTNVVPPFPTHKRVHVGRGVFKSGGSAKKAKVTGIAKRGFGRALMKGKK